MSGKIEIFRVRKNKWDVHSGKPAIVKERTPEWTEWRLQGIGGSDAPIIMGASPWCDRQKLWEIKTRRAVSDPPNSAMQRGLALESKARLLYQSMTGIEMPEGLAINKGMEFVRASLDGMNKEESRVLEIKCPGWKDHKTALEGKIPDKYIWQCVHLLLVTDLDRLDYFSFDGKNGVIVPFERDMKLERELLSKEIEFWDCVQKDIRPDRKTARTATEKEMNNYVLPMEKEKVVSEIRQKNGTYYTAREVIEILNEAKNLGVTTLKLAGFEAAFNPQSTPGSESSGEQCDECGAEKIQGTYGLYCRECYLNRKEKNWKQKRRW